MSKQTKYLFSIILCLGGFSQAAAPTHNAQVAIEQNYAGVRDAILSGNFYKSDEPKCTDYTPVALAYSIYSLSIPEEHKNALWALLLWRCMSYCVKTTYVNQYGRTHRTTETHTPISLYKKNWDLRAYWQDVLAGGSALSIAFGTAFGTLAATYTRPRRSRYEDIKKGLLIGTVVYVAILLVALLLALPSNRVDEKSVAVISKNITNIIRGLKDHLPTDLIMQWEATAKKLNLFHYLNADSKIDYAKLKKYQEALCDYYRYLGQQAHVAQK